MAMKALGIKAIRQQNTTLWVEAQQVLSATQLCGRRHHHPLASLCPALHPLGPGVSMGPACRRFLCDGLQHEQFCPMQVPKDGSSRSQSRRRFVERGEVMQMKQIGLLYPSLVQD